MKEIKKYNLESNSEESDHILIHQEGTLKFISRIINNKFSGILLTIIMYR
jgi:hypothetical protein